MAGLSSRALAIDVPVARRCLVCARLAYLDDPRKELEAAGLTLISFYDVRGTQAFLACAGGKLYLTWRGTSSLGDWFTDLSYVKTVFPGGGRVHLGFYEAFKWVEELIARDLEDFPGIPRMVAGHSLGASEAQLGSVRFGIPEGYVWGCPRVGNKVFTARVDERFHRFEHLTDPVCYLPPRTSPSQIIYALAHRRWPTLYNRADRAHLLNGYLHTMRHYLPSTELFLNSVEAAQRVKAALKASDTKPKLPNSFS